MPRDLSDPRQKGTFGRCIAQNPDRRLMLYRQGQGNGGCRDHCQVQDGAISDG